MQRTLPIRRAVQSLHQSLLRKQSDHVGRAPNKPHRKKSAEGDMGEGDDIVLRVMEAVADERVIQLLQKAPYPQMLLDNFAEMNTRIDCLTAQLTAKDNIAALEKRVEELEESVDRTEQYSRRSNLLFNGFKETGDTENTDDRIISLVNDAMKLIPPLQAHDIARSHRIGGPREGGHPRPIIVRFSSDKAARDAVYRARSGLKTYNRQHREAPVFVNNDLTTRREKLAFDCRTLKKENKIADTWTYNGKVVIKNLTGKIMEVGGPAVLLKAKLWEISSDTHQLQLIKLHHFKLERFKSI